MLFVISLFSFDVFFPSEIDVSGTRKSRPNEYFTPLIRFCLSAFFICFLLHSTPPARFILCLPPPTREEVTKLKFEAKTFHIYANQTEVSQASNRQCSLVSTLVDSEGVSSVPDGGEMHVHRVEQSCVGAYLDSFFEL